MSTLLQQGVFATQVRGESKRFSVTIGAVAMSAGDLFVLTSGLAVDVADGTRIDGVLARDGAVSETNVPADILVDGDVWDFTVASLTADMGTPLATSGATTLDAGTTGDESIGIIIEGAITTAEVQARVLIQRRLIP